MAGKSKRFKDYEATPSPPPSFPPGGSSPTTPPTGCALPLGPLLVLVLALIGMLLIGQFIGQPGLRIPRRPEPTASWVPVQPIGTPTPWPLPAATPGPGAEGNPQSPAQVQVVQVIQPIPVVIPIPVIQQPEMVLTQQQAPQFIYHQAIPAWGSYGSPHAHSQPHTYRPGYHTQAQYSQAFRTPRSHPYIVQRGDTVCGLARRFGVDSSSIVRTNGLSNPNYIRIGQVLQIPYDPRR
jgi:hypothetical protein